MINPAKCLRTEAFGKGEASRDSDDRLLRFLMFLEHDIEITAKACRRSELCSPEWLSKQKGH
jgi:hypothetical protein